MEALMFLHKILFMKGFRLAIFLTIFFLLYLTINYYIYASAIGALRYFATGFGEYIFPGFFCVMVFSYPVARIFGKWLPMKLSDFLTFLGGLWFAAMLYLVLSLLLIDITKFIISFFPVINAPISNNLKPINTALFMVTSVGILILLIYGYLNAIKPRIKTIACTIEKSPPELKSLHIAVASDIHLGHIIGKKSLKKILASINSLNPDLVLFPGDLVDEDLKPVMAKKLGVAFQTLKPRYGVFAVTGNHEYIGGADQAVEYLSKYGIRFLRDEMINIADKFIVSGREDISTNTFYGKPRKPLSILLEGANKQLPVILMDHQPVALAEAVKEGVDLQVSGHTHHGQMWPLQAITKRVFRLSWGYSKIGRSHFYVSSGVGSWGPRVRIGNHPEVVSINLTFQS